MFRKDPIFWLASSIFIAGIVIFGITQNQMWLFLLIGAYLLRPTLASLNVARHLVDERQMSIQYRSGNIAFSAMIIGSVIMSVYLSSKGDHSWELFNAIVILGLAVKAVSNVFLIGNYRESGAKIIIAVGLMMVLFASLEGGFSFGTFMESVPGLVIIAAGVLSKKHPQTSGILILVIAAALLILIMSRGLVIGQIITALIVCSPLVIAGVSLISGSKVKNNVENAEEDLA